jgi:diguanylate cyclase (GGDEF)-like protein
LSEANSGRWKLSCEPRLRRADGGTAASTSCTPTSPYGSGASGTLAQPASNSGAASTMRARFVTAITPCRNENPNQARHARIAHSIPLHEAALYPSRAAARRSVRGLRNEFSTHTGGLAEHGSVNRRLLCSVLLLAGLVPAARALDPDKSFSHYDKDAWSIEQGLPQISALAIAQDGEGYVWVGTQAGLARFDGIRFVAFNPENTPGFPGILTQALYADRDGTLWIGTYKGVARYSARRFETIPVAGDAAVGLDVRDLLRGEDGRLLVATTVGVYELRDGALHRVAGIPEAPAFALESDAQGWWIGSEAGAWRIDAAGARLVALPDTERPATVNRLLHAQGHLWAGTSRGLFHLVDGHWERLAEAAAVSGPIEAMLEDRDGNLWVSAHQSLLRLQDGRLAERIPDDLPGGHRAVRSIFEDREGNLWLGSQWEGVARLWNGWTRRYSVEHGLADPIVWSVARDPDGRLWVGGNDGLSEFDGERFERVVQAEQLPHPNAYTLLAEPGLLWIGTRRGLVQYTQGRVLTPPEFAPIANLQVNGLLRDRSGVLWIATMGGLFRHAAGVLQRQEAAELSDPRIRLLLERRDGSLLVGTQNGLLELRDGQLKRLDQAAGLPPALDVTALYELPDGTLLVGTLSEQVFHFDGKSWFDFGPEHGLPVNSPFFITLDSQGWVWVAGIRGVYRVPLQDLVAVRAGTLAQARGQMLLSERGDTRGSQKGYCCNGAGNAKGFIEADRLWLPTRGGVVTLTSAEVVTNAVVPPVVVERMRYEGDWHALLPTDRPQLPLGARDVAFEFSSLSYQQPRSIAMRYRLRGYDRDWHALADITRRDATYTNLAPGSYVFEVEGSNNALLWNPASAEVAFQIPPRFIETGSFYAIIALLLISSGIGVQRLQTRQLRQKQQALEKLVDERTQDLAAANRRLQEMSHTDALTGLRNRRFLASQLPADLAFYLREVRKPGNEGMAMMLAVVDIDHFKLINDRHGHRAGDRVLQQFARLLEQQVRSGDYVVRWGGEEFLLVFRPMPVKEAAKIAERVRQAIATFPFDVEAEAPLPVTASIGFVEYPLFREAHQLPDWERMVELADLALYVVKSSGRNGWATFRATQAMPLETLLDEVRLGVDAALASGRVVLVRSPVPERGGPDGGPPAA